MRGNLRQLVLWILLLVENEHSALSIESNKITFLRFSVLDDLEVDRLTNTRSQAEVSSGFEISMESL